MPLSAKLTSIGLVSSVNKHIIQQCAFLSKYFFTSAAVIVFVPQSDYAYGQLDGVLV